jgi:hypothetical protein
MKLVMTALGAMVAVIAILIVAEFIANANTATLNTTTLLIVNNVTTFLGIGLLVAIVVAVVVKKSGGSEF